MKEQTSSFDDVEKRLAVFAGLGAFLLNSLVCLWQGSELETYLIRGTLVLTLVTLAAWIYGGWLRKAVLRFSENEDTGGAEIRVTDAPQLEKLVDMPGAGATVIPAEAGTGRSVDFTLPEFEPVAPSIGDLPDLPPPPVPSGLK